MKRKTPRIYGVSRLHFLRLLMCSAKVHPGGFLLEITIFVSIFSWMHVLFITEKRLRIVKSDNFIIYFIRFFRFSMASLLKSLIGEFRKFQLELGETRVRVGLLHTEQNHNGPRFGSIPAISNRRWSRQAAVIGVCSIFQQTWRQPMLCGGRQYFWYPNLNLLEQTFEHAFSHITYSTS